jgi:hypothetical protein
MNTNGSGDLLVTASLKGATPNRTYHVALNQDPGGCNPVSKIFEGVLTTNNQGNGTAHVSMARIPTAVNFWTTVIDSVSNDRYRTRSVVLD